MATIADRVPIVQSLLGGRTDKSSLISQWLANGYRDLAHSIPFETLEDTQNSSCVASIDTYQYPPSARAIKAITLGVPAVNAASYRPLYKRNAAIIDRYSPVPTGVPAIWCPFGTNFIVRPVPNDAYPLIIRFWQVVAIGTNPDGSPNYTASPRAAGSCLCRPTGMAQ